MNSDNSGVYERAPGDAETGLPKWSPTWDAAGLELDADSEIEVRFTALVARYGEMLRRFLHGLSHRREVAEDLSQQLWLKLLEAARLGRFLPTDDTALRSYLFAAARNLFLDECVRRHSSSRTTAQCPSCLESMIDAGTGDGDESPADSYWRGQATVAVRKALERLPASQRTVIELWMAGASIEKMMATTGACRDTVLSRKKYGMRRLRGHLTVLRSEV